jgi:hypothetical protein
METECFPATGQVARFRHTQWHGHCGIEGAPGHSEELESITAYRHVASEQRRAHAFPRVILWRESKMKRSLSGSVALVLLGKVWAAYEYPGQLVLSDIARLKKAIQRAYSAAMRGV